ncbi:chemotaxis protein CheR [Thiocapsa imhoffii]|uniref:protein-glutamate O-methyltransferase n=2 Tax=Thiocapsa imhoffii TaxID=382777 RepID=A0A9X0WK92_9GAMM|nr:chemotaxis protein CheR [Thiocapsa imhoffii]
MSSTAPKQERSAPQCASESAREAESKASETCALLGVTEDSPITVADPGCPIVGIGASAGGLDAFRRLLGRLPPDAGLAYVLVQHLDPDHTSLLATLLAGATRMPVLDVVDGLTVERDHVYVIPPNCTLGVHHRRLLLLERQEERGLHLPVDYFFKALAKDVGAQAIGVVLSGTASDGTQGLAAIKAAGGITFAQDEASAEHFGMPGSAIAAGCVDFVLSPGEIATELVRIVHHPYLHQPGYDSADELFANESELSKIFMILRARTGNDFTLYKRTTILRRIKRRMAVHKLDRVSDYVHYLQTQPTEVSRLFDDLLINVTGFFREPDAFETLREQVFPIIFDRLSSDSGGEFSARRRVRVWVPGCASGEEAYSLAILIIEYLGERAHGTTIQIFGTDIDVHAIDKARTGLFGDEIVTQLSPARLRRFFVKVAGGYQITKGIRDLCVFAVQNLVKDPPFSRLDLVSCRNLMIYLGLPLQKRALQTFHYALDANRFLMLGASESIGAQAELFALVDAKGKIYLKKSNAPRLDHGFMPPVFAAADEDSMVRRTRATRGPADLGEATDRLILKHYSPAGVVISSDLEVLHFRGETGPYLNPLPGAATLNLLKLARPELAFELRVGIQKTLATGEAVRQERVWLRHDGEETWVGIRVLPMDPDASTSGRMLILFEEQPVGEVDHAAAGIGETGDTAADARISALNRELTSTREYLQSIIGEQERINEELKAANEEIQSANEELQSTNEELETAKEELQSTNEELATVNDELENRNQDLGEANSDLTNLLASVNLPILILGPDLCIRQFTPQAQRLLNLIAGDLGRPIGNIKPNLEIPDLEERVHAVIDQVSVQEFELQDREGHWYSVRIRPYKSLENRIDGVVIAFIDVDVLKDSQRLSKALEQEQRLAALVRDADDAMTVHGFDGRILAWNPAAERSYGYLEPAALASRSEDLMPEDALAVHRAMIARMRNHERVEPFMTKRLTADGRHLRVLIHPTALLDANLQPYALATTERILTESSKN